MLGQCLIEKDSFVREAIFTSLTVIGNDTVVKGLIDLLRSDDPAIRNEAIEALRQLQEKFSLFVPLLLSDPDPDVHILTINVLEAYPTDQVEGWLLELLGTDEDPNVCATAADLLAEIGSKKAVPALEQLKKRFASEPYLVYVADLALQRIAGV